MEGALLDSLPHGVMLVDTSLRVRRFNTALAELIGYRTEEAAGLPAEFFLRSSVEAADALAARVLRQGERIVREGTILTRTRTLLPVRFTLSRIPGQDGAEVVLVVERQQSAVTATGGGIETRLIGHSPQMQEVFERMAILARTDASVLITGETGCGKDCIAEELHAASDRAGRAFVKVNCGALPESLLESELFGHKRGAFTGAVNDHPGRFRMADKGTLFLTEIGDLSLPLQVKLLSVLDDRQFYPVGSSSRVRVDVRLIAATHRDLRREVNAGRFREDLFFRLNVLHLHLPPLRERKGDVRLLLDWFLRNRPRADGFSAKRFSAGALALLCSARWPGNVRELRNVVEYGVHMCRGEEIGVGDLPGYLLAGESSPVATADPPPADELKTAPLPLLDRDQAERQRIAAALERTGGHRGRAAALLGIGRTTLWRKMKSLSAEGR